MEWINMDFSFLSQHHINSPLIFTHVFHDIDETFSEMNVYHIKNVFNFFNFFPL